MEQKVKLSIGDSGLVDGTKAGDGFVIATNYFVVHGNGSLKLPVGISPVLFTLANASGLYSPVLLRNTGTPDNFTVNVKNSFDHPVPDTVRVVNNQWTIAEETPGGSNILARFAWETASQAAYFDTTQLLAVMQYDGKWKLKRTAVDGGDGSTANPFTATVTGLNNFSLFGITNYTKANASLQAGNLTHTYNGLPHEAIASAYGTDGITDTLTPAVSISYKDPAGNILNSLPRNAGTYAATVFYTGNDYYNPDSAVYSFIINPASLAIKAGNREKEYGDTIYLGTENFVTSGLIAGDTVSSVSLYSSAGAAAIAKVGSYPPIIPSMQQGLEFPITLSPTKMAH